MFTKISTEVYVGDIHNDMIKQFENGGLASVVDDVKHKVMISDEILSHL